LAGLAKEVVLRTGQYLWREGHPANNLGVVMSGRLKVTRSEPRGETILDIVVPGRVLGEVAFSAGTSYQSDVVCLRRARVAVVSTTAFRAAMRAEPHVAEALAMDLAAHVVRLYRSAQELSGSSVQCRLARVLLRLADDVGEPFPGGTFIPARLRRADLAAMAATTLESVSRKVSVWTRLGWLRPQPVGYLIRDRGALQRLVDGG
jgi:CRP/FNR family transcriptional regulator, nitrogen oxide reductase regulator